MTQKDGSACGTLDDEPLGASEIISLIIEVATGLGTNAAYDVITKRFRDYRNGRRHMQIEQVEATLEPVDAESGEAESD
ncbi:hypothetical protein [Streptomyces sp. NPDC051016]|uniref:hypothetical protein n=1 Tax=Streptomyces sp. NPDC051016 TaxID=3365638 RepID=UPI0037BA965D